MARQAAMALAALLWLVGGCGDDAGAVEDAWVDAEAGLDAAVDARVDADAGRDADLPDCYDPIRQTFAWPPEPTEYDFCDDMLFKLPEDMRKEETGCDVSLRGNDLLYEARNMAEGEGHFSLYYFDLATCRHYRVAWQEPQLAYNAAVWDHKVAVNWALPCSDSVTQFYVIDLADWSYEQVTFDDNGGGALTMGYNGRYLGWYGAFDDSPSEDHWETRVMDLETGLYQEVAQEPIVSPFPRPWKTVLAMNTTKYISDPQDRYPMDIMLLDTETGVERRVTSEPGYVFLPGGFDPPWLVIGVYAGVKNRHNFWVLNVYEAGLIDEDGHVVPGGPVIAPPGFDD
ncbi:MAG: hypothetical protein J7M25_08325 [Deltaproteobacteria bacterium]|nr:hypothetical protein [Deltaproteobacteria bacterium]